MALPPMTWHIRVATASDMRRFEQRSTIAITFLVASIMNNVVVGGSITEAHTNYLQAEELASETCSEQECAYELLLLQTQLDTGVVQVGALGDVVQQLVIDKFPQASSASATIHQNTSLGVNLRANLSINLTAQQIVMGATARPVKPTTTYTFPESLEPWERDYIVNSKPTAAPNCHHKSCGPTWFGDVAHSIGTFFSRTGEAFASAWKGTHWWLTEFKPTAIALITSLILCCCLSCICAQKRASPHSSHW